MTTSDAIKAAAARPSEPGACRRPCGPLRFGECGAHPRREAAPHSPGSAREGVVGDRGEALLVHPQGEQQVRDPVGGRQLGLGRADAVAVHAPATRRYEQGARLSHQPDAEVAALEREPGPALELALLVAEQVAEETLRRRLRRIVARPLRPHHAGAAERVQLGDDPGVGEGRQRHRGGERLEPQHPGAGDHERNRVEHRPRVPDAAPAQEPARVRARSPRDRGELWEGLLGAHGGG